MARVLIIDDDFLVAQLLREHLTNEGHEITVVHLGEEGFETALRSRPELIMLDVNLPDATGFQVCGRLRENPSTKAIPIVMMTGAARFPTQQTIGRQMGANEYILKPFDVIEVGERVKKLIDPNYIPVETPKAPPTEAPKAAELKVTRPAAPPDPALGAATTTRNGAGHENGFSDPPIVETTVDIFAATTSPAAPPVDSGLISGESPAVVAAKAKSAPEALPERPEAIEESIQQTVNSSITSTAPTPKSGLTIIPIETAPLSWTPQPEAAPPLPAAKASPITEPPPRAASAVSPPGIIPKSDSPSIAPADENMHLELDPQVRVPPFGLGPISPAQESPRPKSPPSPSPREASLADRMPSPDSVSQALDTANQMPPQVAAQPVSVEERPPVIEAPPPPTDPAPFFTNPVPDAVSNFVPPAAEDQAALPLPVADAAVLPTPMEEPPLEKLQGAPVEKIWSEQSGYVFRGMFLAHLILSTATAFCLHAQAGDIFRLATMTSGGWALLTGILVIVAAALGIALEAGVALRILGVAAVPIVLRALITFLAALLPGLEYLRTASNPRAYPVAVFWLRPLDIFEMTSIVILGLLLRRQPKSTVAKSLIATIVIALAWALTGRGYFRPF